MRILGIESSCDETAAAVYDSERGLLSHAIHSQVKMHQEYGGVVPELASRDHVRKILPIVDEVLKQADSSRQDITAIAYTAGPGLLGALMVGACFAKSLAWAWGIPSIGVHHLEAHLLAPLLEEHAPDYPFVALLVSGGHTQIMQVDGFGQYKLLGETLDDAVGEAFDKTAKLMGMEYPGGPKLAKLAEQGDPARFNFPRPMVNRPGMDFSFSGLKTFALNTWQAEQPQTDDLEKLKADIARAFQDAVVDTLCIKSKRALEQTGFSRLVVAGGVSANVNLRQQLNHLAKKMQVEVFYPRHEFCTDNAAMVAFTGYQRLLHGAKPDTELRVRARWPLTECPIMVVGKNNTD